MITAVLGTAEVVTYEAYWSRQVPCVALAICLYRMSLLIMTYDNYTVTDVLRRQIRQYMQADATLLLRATHPRAA